jgi:alanyl-tRNA synthetase
LAAEKNIKISREEFEQAMVAHQEISRTGAEKRFAGGLADHSKETTKLHTATHLLHQALQEILGGHVRQAGSNITRERLRFDFTHPSKATREELSLVEKTVNQKIEEDLPVHQEIVTLEEAHKRGAIGLFGEKYGDQVKIYIIGDPNDPYSVECCGGPHVGSTGEIGKIHITKEESAGSGIRRIYVVREDIN